MTLIMGLNLSDRLYIASDTRVTHARLKQDGTILSSIPIDNVLKGMPLWDKALGKHEDDGNFITLAVAGDVELATYMYEHLRKDLLLKNLSSDIRELYEQIESFLETKLNEWVIDLKKTYPKGGCALLFGGTSWKRKKEVNREKLFKLVEVFKESRQNSLVWRPKVLKELENENSPLYQINEELKKAQGKTILQLLDESSIPKIPAYIEKAFQSEPSILEDFSDSMIFGVSIGLGGNIRKEKAEWGEMLAYGAVEDPKKHITDEILAIFELNRDGRSTIPHQMEAAMSTGAIMDLAKKNNINSIGGTVTVQIMSGDSIRITGDKLTMDEQDQKIIFDLHGHAVDLVPFNTYHKLMMGNSDRAEL
ncbi:MAG: hypothetical protein WAX80_02610 [Minisyncoccia bacterium]